jgi:predicted RNase H-like nuclease (RuvC/YqgF family)
MASFLSLYNEIEHKIRVAVTSLNEIKIENRQLKTQLIEQQERIDNLEKTVETLTEKNKVLTITKTVLYKEDKKDTIKKINELVREIDNCIGLLNRVEWKKEE